MQPKEDEDMETKLLDAKDLASELKLSRSSVYRRLSTGFPLPPPIRIGRLVRWRPEDVATWIAENLDSESP